MDESFFEISDYEGVETIIWKCTAENQGNAWPVFLRLIKRSMPTDSQSTDR